MTITPAAAADFVVTSYSWACLSCQCPNFIFCYNLKALFYFFFCCVILNVQSVCQIFHSHFTLVVTLDFFAHILQQSAESSFEYFYHFFFNSIKLIYMELFNILLRMHFQKSVGSRNKSRINLLTFHPLSFLILSHSLTYSFIRESIKSKRKIQRQFILSHSLTSSSWLIINDYCCL